MFFLEYRGGCYLMTAENHYFVHWNDSPDLAPFSHYLREVGALKFSGIKPHSLDMHYNEGIELNFVIGGTYKWRVEDRHYQLFPGEAFITCPWEWHGSPDEKLDRGILSWMILQPESFTTEGNLELGPWSRLHKDTQQEIGRLIAKNRDPVIPKGNDLIKTFRKLNADLIHKELGYEEHINLLLDSMLIQIARSLSNRETREERDSVFVSQLTQMMKDSFNKKMNVADVAYSFDMSTTSFNNKVKTLTGFSPADYLIELKMEASKNMLVKTSESVTDISIECGFYSSQHFATLFAKRVGMTPSQFRKKHRLQGG